MFRVQVFPESALHMKTLVSAYIKRHLTYLFILLSASSVLGETTMSRPVTIDAHHGTHDAFVACLCGILQSWDREADYAYVSGLAGVAFSPVYDEDEDCRAWWMEGGNDIRLDFLGLALGFTVETVRIPDAFDDGKPYDSLDDMPPPRADHFRKLKAALDRGDAVLVPTWPSWSILTGWDEDMTQLPFETVPGLGDLVSRAWPPNRTGLAHILSPAEPSLSRDDAIRQALVFGASIADGTFHTKQRFHYGGRLYEAAAKRLDHDPFCEPCGDKSWSCAIRTLYRIAGTAGGAADFLEQVGLPAEAAPYWEIQTTASQYKSDRFESDWNDPRFMYDLKQTFHQLHRLHAEASTALANSRSE